MVPKWCTQGDLSTGCCGHTQSKVLGHQRQRDFQHPVFSAETKGHILAWVIKVKRRQVVRRDSWQHPIRRWSGHKIQGLLLITHIIKLKIPPVPTQSREQISRLVLRPSAIRGSSMASVPVITTSPVWTDRSLIVWNKHSIPNTKQAKVAHPRAGSFNNLSLSSSSRSQLKDPVSCHC